MVTFAYLILLFQCYSHVFIHILISPRNENNINECQKSSASTLIEISSEEMKACVCTGLGCSGLLWTVLQFLIIFYLSATSNLCLIYLLHPILYMTMKAETKYVWFTTGSPGPSKEWALNKCVQWIYTRYLLLLLFPQLKCHLPRRGTVIIWSKYLPGLI